MEDVFYHWTFLPSPMIIERTWIIFCWTYVPYICIPVTLKAQQDTEQRPRSTCKSI